MSKRSGFISIIDYICKDKGNGVAISRNIFSDENDIKSLKKEFMQNASYIPKRKNGVMLYHELISLPSVIVSSATTKQLNDVESILIDLADRYLQIRAPNCLAYGKVHLDTHNPHIHLVISSNPRKSQSKHRLSLAGFQDIKIKLEKYKQRKYPQFKKVRHFVPEEVKEKRKHCFLSRHEQEMKRRAKGKPLSKKELAIEKITECLSSVNSLESYLKKLKTFGLKHYTRGKTYGVQDLATGKKYRLKTLGVFCEFENSIKLWNRFKTRKRELNHIDAEKGKQLSREID